MIGSLRCAGTGRMVKAGISMTHLHILWVLEHHGDLPMSRLAELLDVSLSNATGLIDRMEERGLVERVRVPDDRRVVLVRASAEGARIARRDRGAQAGPDAVDPRAARPRRSSTASSARIGDLRAPSSTRSGPTTSHAHARTT